jgi:predicted transcriptional regulator
MRRTPTLVAVLLVAVVMAGAGCGGEDEVPASTRWAGDLCTAVNTWRDSISSAAASIASNPSQAGLQEAADDATSATQALVDDLRGLGAPETESGEQVRETLDDLAGSVESSIATIEEAADDVSGVSGLLEAVSTVSGTISAISAQLSSSLDELRSLENVDDELTESFQDAPACDGLASSDS